MEKVFDVILIGAGIVGATASLEVGKLGLKVALFDEARMCGGASKMSGGICRVFDQDQTIAEWALESIAWYDRMLSDFGLVLGERRHLPFKYMVDSRFQAQAESMLKYLATKTNYPVVGLDVTELRHTISEKACYSRSLVVSETNSFFIDVNQMVNGLISIARGYGVLVFECNPVVSINPDVSGYQVKTKYGSYSAPVVICAAGGASVSLLQGIVPKLPQRAKAVEAFIFNIPKVLPFSFVDESTGLYGRPLENGLSLIGFPTNDWMGLSEKKIEPARPSYSMIESMNELFGAHDWQPLGHRYAFDTYFYGEETDCVQELLPGLYTYLGRGGGVKIAPAIGRVLSARARSFLD